MATNLIKRGGVWWFKKMINGKLVQQSLKTTEKEAAKAKAKDLVKAMGLEQWEKVFAVKTVNQVCTVKEILDRYEAALDLRVSPRAMQSNANYLKRIIRTVLKVENPETQLATVITGSLARKYQLMMLATVDAKNIKAVDTVSVTCNSALGQARSVFSKKAMQKKVYEGLNIGTTWKEFVELEKLPVLPRDDYKMPEDSEVSSLWTATAELKKQDPAVWLAFWLASMTGLRRGEIMYARWNWLKEEEITICTETDFSTKSGRERVVPADPAVRLEALKLAKEQGWDTSPKAYVLPYATKTGRYKVFRRLGKWMKELNWTRRQKAHELRKIFASVLCKEASPYAAQLALGHSKIQTTTRYAARPKLQSVNPSALYVLPDPAPVPPTVTVLPDPVPEAAAQQAQAWQSTRPSH